MRVVALLKVERSVFPNKTLIDPYEVNFKFNCFSHQNSLSKKVTKSFFLKNETMFFHFSLITLQANPSYAILEYFVPNSVRRGERLK